MSGDTLLVQSRGPSPTKPLHPCLPSLPLTAIPSHHPATPSPHHPITPPPRHSVTPSSCHPVTLSLHHPTTLSPCNPTTLSPHHPAILSPHHPITLPPCHPVTPSPHHPSALSALTLLIWLCPSPAHWPWVVGRVKSPWLVPHPISGSQPGPGTGRCSVNICWLNKW